MMFIDTPSPSFNARTTPITMIVLHYTGMVDAAAAIARLSDPASKVSCHYLIAEDGQVVRMVAEENRAWHAGKGRWRSVTDVNSASVGIEIVNPGHELGYRDFPDQQMDAVMALVADLVRRHGVAPSNVVGHSDIAPARKRDPGELFDWNRLAERGLALRRPRAGLSDPLWTDAGFLMALDRFGYDVADPLAAVYAFQRRFRPERIDGLIDGELRAILLSLLLDRETGRAI